GGFGSRDGFLLQAVVGGLGGLNRRTQAHSYVVRTVAFLAGHGLEQLLCVLRDGFQVGHKPVGVYFTRIHSCVFLSSVFVSILSQKLTLTSNFRPITLARIRHLREKNLINSCQSNPAVKMPVLARGAVILAPRVL